MNNSRLSNILIGHNCSNLSSCIDEALESKAKCIQIFTRNPTSFALYPDNDTLLSNIKTLSTQLNIKIVIHGSFLINLCKPSNQVTQMKKLLQRDLCISKKLGAIGVIIHMGHNVDKKLSNEEALKLYVQNIDDILEVTPSDSILILETGAGCGNEIGTRLNDLGKIRLNSKYKERIRFCIDTCHIFSAGYDISNSNIVESLEAYIDLTLGWENVITCHLNDSKTNLNSKKDRHQDISYGLISKGISYNDDIITEDTITPFVQFIKYFIKRKIPIILETPCEFLSYSEQLNLIKLLLENN
jgi:deoxyribonuclease-4